MPQFARPTADTYNSDGWTDEAAGGVNIFDGIDEVAASDADYIQSASAPTADPVVFALGTIEDPVSSAGHVVRYRYQKNAAGGAQIDLTVELRQGYVNEATPGTLIATQSQTNIANGWADGTITLSAGEADAITDYTALFIRIVANQV